MQINDAEISATTRMEPTDPVSTIMTKSVVVANPSHKFSDVLNLFSNHDMHHLPIVDDSSNVIGIVSSNDLMKVFINPKYKGLCLNTDDMDKAVSIPDIMTPNVITISSTASIREAAKTFLEGKFLAVPVVDGGQIVGILSARDLVYLIAYFS